MTLRIVVGGHDAGFAYKTAIIKDLETNAAVSTVVDIGPKTAADKSAYASNAIAAAEVIAKGDADRTILICSTGLGVAIAAKKVPGIHAVTAHDSFSVERAIKSKNAQVLCLGQRVIGIELARRLVTEWLSYEFDPKSASAAKVSIIDQYDAKINPIGSG